MGFFRKQEERLTIHYLTWQYQKRNLSVPPISELERLAHEIVDEAHRIAARRGRNVMGIIKELVQEIKGKKES